LENKIWQIKLGSLFPFSADQVVTKTISMIDKQIQSEQFDLIVNDIVDGAMKHKIGRLSFLINRDETLIFCGMATRQWLFPMVSDNRGKILEKLAVDKMAEEQINSLKLDDLEKMIKDVVSNEFKVINMLGGVLGGLIGFVTEILSAMQL
jgi:uncharacterized membrane protein YheB (UPF0754 family)